jgi:hypothetical protein
MTGNPTINSNDEAVRVFADRVAAIVLDPTGFASVPPDRRRSTSIIDASRPDQLQMFRLGSIPFEELARRCQELGLGVLTVDAATVRHLR